MQVPPGTGSLNPVTIGAVAEAMKRLEPPAQRAGDGAMSVYQQVDANHYKLLGAHSAIDPAPASN